MRSSVLALGLLILCLASASPADAATTADFQANCFVDPSGQPIYCSFDASRQSTNGPGPHCDFGSPTWYFWDFGDPNNDGIPDTLWTTSYLASAQYQRGPSLDYIISVTMYCSDGMGNDTSDTASHCFPTSFGFAGCIRANGTWTP